MASLVLTGDTSGQVTLAAAAVAGTNTITVQAATGTMSVNTLATAQASTSGTSIDFTGLPNWIKRITVMLAGVSTNSNSNYLIQLGAGSVVNTGYITRTTYFQGVSVSGVNNTSGFLVGNYGAANTTTGSIVITLLTGNTWIGNGYFADSGANASSVGGSIALSGTLDRVRITSQTPDTFDAGTINILYEG